MNTDLRSAYVKRSWMGGLALACACAGTATPSGSVAPTQQDSTSLSNITAASAIAQLQRQWRQALTTGDTVFFARTLADEFQLTGGRAVLTKPVFLAAVAADSGRVPLGRVEETSIHVYGTVAVATGLIRYDMAGGAASVPSRFTEVWLKQGDRWVAVHGHFNPIQPAPAVLGP
jgi:hypothetical protein